MNLLDREALHVRRDPTGAWVVTLNGTIVVRFRGEDAATRAQRYFADLLRIADPQPPDRMRAKAAS